MGGHRPVPRCWVGDIDRGVVLQHLDEEGGLHKGIVGEAGAQWVDKKSPDQMPLWINFTKYTQDQYNKKLYFIYQQ